MRLFSRAIVALFFSLAIAAAFTPEIHSTSFDQASTQVFYFDDAPVVLNLADNALYLSEDSGKTWEKAIDDIIDNIQIDKVKKERAFAFTTGSTHYVTNNRGKSWDKFEVQMTEGRTYDMNVNYKNPDQIMLAFLICDEVTGRCVSDIYYTTDGFKTNPKLMAENTVRCVFTHSSPVFDAGDDSRIICLKTEFDSYGYLRRSRLLASDDFFKTTPTVLNDASDELANSLVYDLRVIQTFIVAVVQADKYDQSGSSVFLYTSKDGQNFKKATMNEDLVVNGFEFLESTKYSLHVSVWGYSSLYSLSNVLASDDTGLHFRSLLGNVETDILGFANLDKIESIEGVWIANVMNGYDQATYLPLVRSKITFDDGYSWHYMKADDCSGDIECGLNLLSIEELRGDGQAASGATPGILLGIGNTGISLNSDRLKFKTYISRDGGYSWKKTLEFPVIFSFGDLGNVILAAPIIRQEGTSDLTTKELYYSLDQGSSWQTIELNEPVSTRFLSTAIDGSTTSFLYAGLKGEGSNKDGQVFYSLDFSMAFSRNCGDSDFETWVGRSHEGNEDSCLFGHKDIYNRRKADAQCFVNKAFADLKIEETPCECTAADYGCSTGFMENSKGECIPDPRYLVSMCFAGAISLKLQKTHKKSGNLCTGGNVQTEDYEFYCSQTLTLDTAENVIRGKITRAIFMEQSEFHNGDQTVFILNNMNQMFTSHDGGTTFTEFSASVEILDIYLNPFFKDSVYLITASQLLYISSDRGNLFVPYDIPTRVNRFGRQALSFSNSSQSNVVFYGEKGCEDSYSSSCTSIAYITDDGGKTWDPLLENAQRCDFIGSRSTAASASSDLVICQVLDIDRFSLVSSSDRFQNTRVIFENIVGFADTTHYTVVAASEGDSLKAYVTLDGETFAAAQFPKDLVVNRQQAYTILGSQSGAIFFHVTTNERVGSEYGAILKSNANGTSYVLSQNHVNRDSAGFVDYEKVEGLDGIAIINTVKNFVEAKQGSKKQLQTKITFNDGADWDLIQPPSTDSEGKKYACFGKSLRECSLHLHGYTERKDYRDTFSSRSATGLLMAAGNVGESLGPLGDASTFITSDGGSTWKEVKKGRFQWEFGDRGSIIVLVNDQDNTNIIWYSLNEGQTWNDHKFTEDAVRVEDVLTVPSDTSKKFLLLTKSDASRGDESRTFAIDFEQVFGRQCVLDLEHPDRDDFEFWSPKHPFDSSNCLFGHEAKYLRKLRDRTDCFIGSAPLNAAFKIERNCPCTRRDFECDYNYVKVDDGTCKLVKGLEPEDRSEICRSDSNAFEYFEPTGYRKIPMSTCEGGQEFDKWNPVPCPGKEDQFNSEHGGKLGGFGLVMVIIVPILVFVGAAWFVYDRGIRRNGGFARFGEIRLGDQDDLIENDSTDKVVNAIVRGGITVIAAVIATYKVIRAADIALIDKVKSLFQRNNRYRVRGEGFQAIREEDYRDEDGILDDVLNDDDDDIDDEAEVLLGTGEHADNRLDNEP